MKIWGEIPKVTGVYNKQKNVGKTEKTAAVGTKKDVVSISSGAKDFQTVLRALKDVPDIRQSKVSELAEKYETGNYSVAGTQTADRIVSSILDKKV